MARCMAQCEVTLIGACLNRTLGRVTRALVLRRLDHQTQCWLEETDPTSASY